MELSGLSCSFDFFLREVSRLLGDTEGEYCWAGGSRKSFLD